MLAGVLLFIANIGIFYFWVLDNFIAVSSGISWMNHMFTLKDELFWFWFGISLILSVNSSIKLYHYSRRGDKAI